MTSSKNFNNSGFEKFMPTSLSCVGHFEKYLARSSMGKLRIGGSFDLIGSLLTTLLTCSISSNTQKLLETCQKLAFTRPIVV